MIYSAMLSTSIALRQYKKRLHVVGTSLTDVNQQSLFGGIWVALNVLQSVIAMSRSHPDAAKDRSDGQHSA